MVDVQAGGTRWGTRRGRIRPLAVVLALAAILGSTSQALASSPSHVRIDVNVVACDQAVGGGSGTVEVPRGTAFNIAWDWEAFTLAQEAAFLHSAKVAAAIDGNSIARAGRYWTRPYYVADAEYPWFMFWKYPHRGLHTGQSITFTVTPSLRFPVFDGTDWYPRGPIVTLTCTIKGV